MSTVTLHIGDVFDVMRLFAPQGVDLIVTSPPFLALRSYLPADHPDKHREIGSEATPADFLDTLLALTAEWRRVLAPHGSLCVELGDTYSGSGGAGGDYDPDGMRGGQPKFRQAQDRPQDGGYDAGQRVQYDGYRAGIRNMNDKHQGGGPGWPLAKSLTGIPTLYTWSLAYGRNLLTGQPSPAGQWRIRNLLVWARPNPPVGALGDKFRPACSYITVACTGPRRWFDLDAVRVPHVNDRPQLTNGAKNAAKVEGQGHGFSERTVNEAGAPPLDWHDDGDDGPTGDRLWHMPTAPYKGAHYATYPLELPRRLIDAMCPREVCRVCGKARERITKLDETAQGFNRGRRLGRATLDLERPPNGDRGDLGAALFKAVAYETLGWSDCGHDNYRPGLVLDPFLGSGTTAVAAAQLGRDCIGIDLDQRNTGLVHQRLTEKLHIVDYQIAGGGAVTGSGRVVSRLVADHSTDATSAPLPHAPGEEETSLDDPGHTADDPGETDSRILSGSNPRFRAGYLRNDRPSRVPQDKPKAYGAQYGADPQPLPIATRHIWSCDAPLPDQRYQIEGQTNLFDMLEPDMVDVDTGGHL